MKATQAEETLQQVLEGTGNSRQAAEFLTALSVESFDETHAFDATAYPPEVLLRLAVLARPHVSDTLEREPSDGDLVAFARSHVPLEQACRIAVHCALSEASERKLRTVLGREREPFIERDKAALERGLAMVVSLALKAQVHKPPNDADSTTPLPVEAAATGEREASVVAARPPSIPEGPPVGLTKFYNGPKLRKALLPSAVGLGLVLLGLALGAALDVRRVFPTPTRDSVLKPVIALSQLPPANGCSFRHAVVPLGPRNEVAPSVRKVRDLLDLRTPESPFAVSFTLNTDAMVTVDIVESVEVDNRSPEPMVRNLLFDTRVGAGPVWCRWDGRRADGQVVPPGEYQLKVIAYNSKDTHVVSVIFSK